MLNAFSMSVIKPLQRMRHSGLAHLTRWLILNYNLWGVFLMERPFLFLFCFPYILRYTKTSILNVLIFMMTCAYFDDTLPSCLELLK